MSYQDRFLYGVAEQSYRLIASGQETSSVIRQMSDFWALDPTELINTLFDLSIKRVLSEAALAGNPCITLCAQRLGS